MTLSENSFSFRKSWKFDIYKQVAEIHANNILETLLVTGLQIFK